MGSPIATGTRSGSVPRNGLEDSSPRHTSERRTTETKASFKTTEFFAYLGVLAALLIAGLVADNAGAGGLGAQDVWLYATILTVGYMVSRGLAKAGSRDPYTHDRDDHRS
jgi:hypothetical protein